MTLEQSNHNIQNKADLGILHLDQILSEWLRSVIPAGIVVAFSGGVDSALVLYAACRQRSPDDPPVQAVFLRSKLNPSGMESEAKLRAEEWGAIFTVLEFDEFSISEIANNPPDRCYHCKYTLFSEVINFQEFCGAAMVLDGTHADDDPDKRPGMQALQELGVRSPLRELGMGKKDVRALASHYGLPMSNKAAAPCLATRVPYGEFLDQKLLQRIDKSEAALRELGFFNVRVRAHRDIARIEVDVHQLAELVDHRCEILEKCMKMVFVMRIRFRRLSFGFP